MSELILYLGIVNILIAMYLRWRWLYVEKIYERYSTWCKELENTPKFKILIGQNEEVIND